MPRINLFSLPSLVPLSLCLLAPLSQPWRATAQDAIPTPFDKSRYESLRVKSPFAIATAVAAPVPQQPAFAANWFVTGVARIGDNDFATIKSRDLSTQFSLYGDEPVDGVVLASVIWSDTVGKSTVILRKGSETARLEFNQAQLHSPAATTAGSGPAPTGGKPTGTHTAANNPRPGGMNVAAANNNPIPGQLGSGPPRRRVLPIQVPR